MYAIRSYYADNDLIRIAANAARTFQVDLKIAPEPPLALRFAVFGKTGGSRAYGVDQALPPKSRGEDFRIEASYNFV